MDLLKENFIGILLVMVIAYPRQASVVRKKKMLIEKNIEFSENKKSCYCRRL